MLMRCAMALMSILVASWNISKKLAFILAILPVHYRHSICLTKFLPEIRRQTSELAFALNVVGLMNIQFAIREDKIYLLEVNPRGSRTVPFVAKNHRRSACQNRLTRDGW
jgi:predicted ATP-grasp superfamily ATP-dependent carboligase